MKITAQKYSHSKRALAQSRREDYKGFTLVELLVVIAIIAILAAVVVLIINPLELTRRSRDAARLTDLANLQQAINVSVQEATGASATDILCEGGLTHNSDSCYGRSDSDGRTPDGQGWVRADLTTQRSVSVPTLPVDPVNSDPYHYTYCSEGNQWEINTRLESEQQATKMGNDGGDEGGPTDNLATLQSTGRYEVGSRLDLIQATAAGFCEYDE